MQHITVLKKEAVDALALRESSVVVDATLGAGGHSSEILTRLSGNGTLIAIDADSEAVKDAGHVLKGEATLHLEVGNFRKLDSILDHLHIEKIDAILADLGWRMDQFGGNGKGFSFLTDEDLLMTFGDPKDYAFTARDILNEWKEDDIRNVLRGYGEEKFAGRIARHVVETREKVPILTTFDFVNVIEKAVPGWYLHGRLHPATRSFQALRIAVNDEFDALQTFIRMSVERLGEGGRLVVVSFHSIEDRIVKHLFRTLAHDQHGVIITKKPMTPSVEEVRENPRSRSAKMRVFEKHESSN